jgi:predicted DNA-binding protein (MmcQ/YjbR family)
VTAGEFRRLALSLPGAEEREHMNHPDFRVGGKIFATLGYPDATRGMVKLFPDQQVEFVAADPNGFVPVKGAWGKQGCTQVVLVSADKDRVKAAMRAAWERASATVPEKKAKRK